LPPDGAGYKDSDARGPDMVKADFSGTPDEVYAILTAANDDDCSDPLTPERICLKAPKASLLAKRPLREPPGPGVVQDHPTTAFDTEDDATYQTIVRWIEQGAQR